MNNNIKIIEENFISDNEIEVVGTFFNKQFSFYNRYCKNYGEDIQITVGNYTYSLNTISINVQEYSDFPESYKNIINSFSKFFEVEIFTKKEVHG